MQISRHLRSPHRLLSFDYVCWQCRCRMQQRPRSSKAVSDGYGIYKEEGKTYLFNNTVCTKNTAALSKLGISSVNVQTRCSKGATGRLHSYSRAQKPEVEEQLSLLSLPLQSSSYRLSAEANITYKTALSNGNFMDMSLEGQRLRNTNNQQTHRGRLFSVFESNKRFLECSQVYSPKERTWYALQKKSALHHERLGIYSPKLGKRMYSTATAAATSVRWNTLKYYSNVHLHRMILLQTSILPTRMSSSNLQTTNLRKYVSAKSYKVGKTSRKSLRMISIP